MKQISFRVMTAIVLMLAVNVSAYAQVIPRQPAGTREKLPITLTLNKTSLSLEVGKSEQISVSSGLASGEKATWSSSSTAVATVDATGKITAKAAGTATITATAGSKKGTCSVTVKAAAGGTTATKLTLSSSQLEFSVGQQGKKLTVTSGLSAGETATWKSSNTAIVTVDASGNITVKGKGKATITATAGSKQGICDVTVIDPLRKTHLGQGIDIFKAKSFSSEDIITAFPVYNIDKLNGEGKVIQNALTKNDGKFEATAGKTMSDMMSSLNSRNKVSYKGAFSASVSANYNTKSTENRTTMFAKAQGTYINMKENIVSPSASSLKNYVTDAFKKDVSSLSAGALIDRYGTHVIVSCNWGGLAELDYMYTSSKITTTTNLELAVSASVAGFSGSSTNNKDTNKENFMENSSVKISCKGGSVISATTTEGFNQQYGGWINSISQTNSVVCGTDNFGTGTIPLHDIVKQIDATKGASVEAEFKTRATKAESTLNNFKVGIPVLTSLTYVERLIDANATPKIPAGYTHAVLNDPNDMSNSRSAYEASNSVSQMLLWFNKFKDNAVKGVHHMYYQTKYLQSCKGVAIAEIAAYFDPGPDAEKDWAEKIKSGNWIDPKINMNNKCASDAPKKIMLVYRLATEKDEYVIDFIGGRQNTSNNPSQALPTPPAGEKWEWVKWLRTKDSAKEGDMANFDLKCGNAYTINLAVHKVKRVDVENANK